MRKLIGALSICICIAFGASALAWTADTADTKASDNTDKVVMDAADNDDDKSEPQETAKITDSAAPWTDDDFANIAFYDINKASLEAVAEQLPGNFAIKTVGAVVYSMTEDEISLLLPGDIQHLIVYEPCALPTVEVGTIVTLYILLAV